MDASARGGSSCTAPRAHRRLLHVEKKARLRRSSSQPKHVTRHHRVTPPTGGVGRHISVLLSLGCWVPLLLRWARATRYTLCTAPRTVPYGSRSRAAASRNGQISRYKYAVYAVRPFSCSSIHVPATVETVCAMRMRFWSCTHELIDLQILRFCWCLETCNQLYSACLPIDNPSAAAGM